LCFPASNGLAIGMPAAGLANRKKGDTGRRAMGINPSKRKDNRKPNTQPGNKEEEESELEEDDEEEAAPVAREQPGEFRPRSASGRVVLRRPDTGRSRSYKEVTLRARRVRERRAQSDNAERSDASTQPQCF
jgi:hypothetical protein